MVTTWLVPGVGGPFVGVVLQEPYYLESRLGSHVFFGNTQVIHEPEWYVPVPSKVLCIFTLKPFYTVCKIHIVIHIYIYLYTHFSVHIYIYIYIHIHIYIYTCTDRCLDALGNMSSHKC